MSAYAWHLAAWHLVAIQACWVPSLPLRGLQGHRAAEEAVLGAEWGGGSALNPGFALSMRGPVVQQLAF